MQSALRDLTLGHELSPISICLNVFIEGLAKEKSQLKGHAQIASLPHQISRQGFKPQDPVHIHRR